MPTPLRLRLGRVQRVRHGADFDRAYRRGRKLVNDCFSAAVVPSGLDHARIGLSVAARTGGNAVRRNRLRRMIRESFRLEQHRLPPTDIVVGLRNGSRGASAVALREALAALWRRIESECVPS